MLWFIIPLCYSKTFSNNNDNTQDLSILNRITRAAIDDCSLRRKMSWNPWRIPNELSYPSQCKPHCQPVKSYISYVVIIKAEKIVACSKTPLSGSKYTTTLRFLKGRFPYTRTRSIVCKKGYKPQTAQIDVIYQDGNTLTAKKENIVYGCMWCNAVDILVRASNLLHFKMRCERRQFNLSSVNIFVF